MPGLEYSSYNFISMILPCLPGNSQYKIMFSINNISWIIGGLNASRFKLCGRQREIRLKQSGSLDRAAVIHKVYLERVIDCN